jgi:hypothetical protein
LKRTTIAEVIIETEEMHIVRKPNNRDRGGEQSGEQNENSEEENHVSDKANEQFQNLVRVDR